MKFLSLYLKGLLARHEKKTSLIRSFTQGLRGVIAFSILMQIEYFSEYSLVIAPFGASCILLFTRPRYNSSQPINIIGGYFIASIISVLFMKILPHDVWWTASIMLITTITLMSFLRVSHPPAGAVPLVVFFYEQHATFEFVFYNAVVGSFILVIIATILFKLPPTVPYPKKIPNFKL